MNHQEVRDICKRFGIEANPTASASVPRIDPDYNYRKELLSDMMGFFLMPMIAMKLFGYQGSGKTSVVEQFHAALNYPCLSVSCTPHTEAQDLIGKTIPTPEGLKFSYGPVVLAAMNGWSVLLDEYNVLSPGESTGLNQLLQGGSLFIPETSEVIHPAAGFRVFAACNPADQGAGFFDRNEQDAANNDRFWNLWVDYPTPEEETPVIKNVLARAFEVDIAEAFAAKMVEVANKVRKQFMGDNQSGDALETTISTRVLKAWANGLVVFNEHPRAVHYALERASTNSLPRSSSSKQAIHEIVKDIFGVDYK